MPFTSDQFFDVFALYNRAFVVVVVALWLASIGTLAFVLGDPTRRSPTLSLFLGALWLWNAVAYHALFFTRINPAGSARFSRAQQLRRNAEDHEADPAVIQSRART